jgi:hypothetical protein
MRLEIFDSATADIAICRLGLDAPAANLASRGINRNNLNPDLVADCSALFFEYEKKRAGSSIKLVLLFTSLLAIPLTRQCFLDATLFTGLQVVGVTFDFLDNVFLLNLPLKPAERILKRLAFLHTNLCQIEYTP